MLRMKVIIICPNQANGVPVLADSRPLLTLPFLGAPLICHWLDYLAGLGVKEARLITTDDVDLIQEQTGSGSRWGLTVEICHELRELTPTEARKRYRPDYETDWLPAGDVLEANCLPGLAEEKPFHSYESYFKALGAWLNIMGNTKRIGRKQIQPGVWVGRRTRIASSAQLRGPCWIGDNVRIGPNTIVGPNAFLEDEVVVEGACEVAESWVGPATFVGTLTELKHSLAWGNILINWKSGSHISITDSFLLSSLVQTRNAGLRKKAVRKLAGGSETSPLSRPIEAVISLAQKFQS